MFNVCMQTQQNVSKQLNKFTFRKDRDTEWVNDWNVRNRNNTRKLWRKKLKQNICVTLCICAHLQFSTWNRENDEEKKGEKSMRKNQLKPEKQLTIDNVPTKDFSNQTKETTLRNFSLIMVICFLCWIEIWWDLNTIRVKSIRKGRMSKEKWVRHLATLSFVWSAIVKSVVENMKGVTWKENCETENIPKWRIIREATTLNDIIHMADVQRKDINGDATATIFSVFFIQSVHFAPNTMDRITKRMLLWRISKHFNVQCAIMDKNRMNY